MTITKPKIITLFLAILLVGGIGGYSALHGSHQDTPQVVGVETADKEALKQAIYSLAVEKEDFQGAIKASDNFIKRYGDDVDVWVHRGMSYYQLNDCTNATASLYHAAQMNIASESMSVQDINDLLQSVLNSDQCRQ